MSKWPLEDRNKVFNEIVRCLNEKAGVRAETFGFSDEPRNYSIRISYKGGEAELYSKDGNARGGYSLDFRGATDQKIKEMIVECVEKGKGSALGLLIQ